MPYNGRMSVIRFDLLVPTSHVAGVAAQFEDLTALLLRDGKVQEATVTVVADPQLPDGVIAQLRTGYVEEHEERGLRFPVADLLPSRLEVQLSGASSLNQVAMLYSRVLTPAAELPADVMALGEEKSYEVPARFPWLVEIYP